MYYIKEVKETFPTQYRIIRPGDGLVLQTFTDPAKAYMRLSRLELFDKEERQRVDNWKIQLFKLKLLPEAKYFGVLLPSI